MDNQKLIHEFIGKKVRFDEFGGGYIWGESAAGGEQMVAQVEDADEVLHPESPIVSVRGWGAIQHLFSTSKEAAEFQNDLGRWMADAINEKLDRERKEAPRA